jgi:hypothetical protein
VDLLFKIELGGNGPCACHCRLHIRKDILAANMRVELSALHEMRRLLARAAEQQRAPGRLNLIGKIFDRLKPGRIHRRHMPEPHDDDRWQSGKVIRDSLELVGGSKQKRPVNPKHRCVIRNGDALERMDRPSSISVPVTAASSTSASLRPSATARDTTSRCD